MFHLPRMWFSLLALPSLLGGSPPLPPAPVSTQAGPASPAARRPAGVRMPPKPPPLPPRPPSPVQLFRQLLRSNAAEREAWLAQRSPAQRAYLEAQLRTFDALSPAEQEARLRLLELQFYLRPLLRLPPGHREEQLKRVPPAYRAGVRDRLAAWDALAPEERDALLDDYVVAARLCRPAAGKSAALSQKQRERTRRTLERWRVMSAAERRKMADRLGRFFQFSEAEKRRTLEEVAKVSRPQAAGLISRLDRLPPAERRRCLQALERFAALPPAERQRFLSNAARWAAMTPEERRRWRQLQAKLPPMPVKLPPRPPQPPPKKGLSSTR